MTTSAIPPVVEQLSHAKVNRFWLFRKDSPYLLAVTTANEAHCVIDRLGEDEVSVGDESDTTRYIYLAEKYKVCSVGGILPTNIKEQTFHLLARRFYHDHRELTGKALLQLVEMAERYEKLTPEKQRALLSGNKPVSPAELPQAPSRQKAEQKIHSRAEQFRQLRQAVEYMYGGARFTGEGYVRDWSDDVLDSYLNACCEQPTIIEQLNKQLHIYPNAFLQLPSGRWAIAIRGRLIEFVPDSHRGLALLHELITFGYIQRGGAPKQFKALAASMEKGRWGVSTRVNEIYRKQIIRAIGAISEADSMSAGFLNNAITFDKEHRMWQFQDEPGQNWQTTLPSFNPDATLTRTAAGWEFHVPWGWTDGPIRLPRGVRDTGLAHIQTALWVPNGMAVPAGLLGNRDLADQLADVPAYRKLFDPIYPARFRRVVCGNETNSRLANAICESMKLKAGRGYRATDMIDERSELSEFIEPCCDMTIEPHGVAGVLRLLNLTMADLVTTSGNTDKILRLRSLQSVLTKAMKYLEPYQERLAEIGRLNSGARPKVTQAINEAIDWIDSRGSNSWISPESKLAEYLRDHIKTGEYIRHNGPMIWAVDGMCPFPNLIDLFTDRILYKELELRRKKQRFSTIKNEILQKH